MTARRPRVTRVHAASIMEGPRDVLALIDGRLTAIPLGAFLPGGRGRIVRTRGDLLDHAVTMTARARFSAGSGPVVDRILAGLNAVH
jgi:hypothetical protein